MSASKIDRGKQTAQVGKAQDPQPSTSRSHSATHIKYYVILVADSRARGFQDFDKGKCYTYVTQYICKPGARISDLTEQAVSAISDIPKDNTRVIVKIAAGVNNLTIKVPRRRSYELTPAHDITADEIIDELTKLKNDIKDCRTDAIISFMTIPPINFLQQLHYAQSTNRLPFPIYTEGERIGFQDSHQELVQEINQKINKLNHQTQEGIRCQTASWHSEVTRRQRGQLRLIVSSLYDGVHGTDKTKAKWHRSFHQAVLKEIAQLQRQQ